MFSPKMKFKPKSKSSKLSGKKATTNINDTQGLADNAKNSALPSISMSITRKPPIIYMQSTTARTGLTPKEKSYLISSCQRHNNRYAKLKSLALEAMKNNKVYIVYGNNGVIRRAMNTRGWVEKIPAHSMNFSRLHRLGATKIEINNELERLLLSNFFEKHTPNFMWKVRDTGRQSLDMNEFNNTIINKLRTDTVWATKQGLCSTMKHTNWFHIEKVAETQTPRTYSGSDKDDVDEFTADYTFTACTGLLNWFLKIDGSERVIFTKTGKVPKHVLIFALNRCKEFLLSKQNKDIDYHCRSISTKIWNSFLSNYYKLVTDKESFEEDIERNVPLYTAYAKILLMEIQKYRPQIKCEGFHNIWILKPGHCSRGRGIRLVSNLTQINNLLSKSSQKQVIIQKYIEEPLLIHETKFDIRQYYLVTSTFPLIIWMYKDCYLKFSSQKYSLSNYHESIHLTNNAVQKKYRNCRGRHSELPNNNMWSLERYKDYLKTRNKNQVWDDIIYPGMKKCIIGVMLSCQDHMSPCRNRFELYGCDFVLDGDYKPWLIEINSCPDLNPTTNVTAKICSAVVEDIVKVVIDRPDWIKANTGQFECAYRQPITAPIYRRAAELLVCGSSLPNTYFCKSSIVHDPFDNSVDIERECDILNTFKQLKALYAEDNTIKSSIHDAEVSESEEELGQAAKAINSRLTVMLETLPIDPSITTKASRPSSSTSIQESLTTLNLSYRSDKTSENNISLQSYFSEIDFTTMVDESRSRSKRSSSLALLNVEYNIEEVSSLHVAERIIHSMSKKLSTDAHAHLLTDRYISNELVVFPDSNLENQKKLTTAASKILNFITEKQNMYIN